MNTIEMSLRIEDSKLLQTLYTTIDVEMEATNTERGQASTRIDNDKLIITIEAHDLVATRAITNSIMRLLQVSVDVAESIRPR